MPKAPSFQFYVKDWLCDPELRSASLLSRGAWIDCICFMWENSQRGELTRTPLKFARLISGSLDEALHFLNEIHEYEFGDIEVEENIGFPLTEMHCNAKVTIRNRRMYSDYKDRQNTRLRVRKHRQKVAETEKKQKRNTDVTPSSPSPTSTTKHIEYPEWLNLKLWKEYKKYRTKIKAPMTDHAEQLSLTALKEQIDAGYQQDDIINQTIQSGKWKSFFPVKNKNPIVTPKEIETPDYLKEIVGGIGKKF